jgi:hypothetical protein
MGKPEALVGPSGALFRLVISGRGLEGMRSSNSPASPEPSFSRNHGTMQVSMPD